ncbi:MAG TPA: hypothetical protein VE996_01720 [Terriglobales bacterium]|nr:hypothetical protein [Terriglobales bacterium]
MTKEDGFPREDSRLAPGETLHEFFAALVVKNYSAVGLSETALTDYVTQVLEAFVRAEASRQPVAALLAASDPVYGEASSFAREAAVRRRIGDVTLFFTGMFPESLARRRGADALLDYVAAGKESYHIVSEYERTRQEMEPPPELAALASAVLREAEPRAPLFAQLSAEFERCMYGLNLVKSEIASFADPLHAAVRALLLN